MDEFTLPKLPPRPTDGHKGTFGTVGIIGGSVGNTGGPDKLRPRMIGAPALVAKGANRAGCGLVKIGAPEPILNAVLTLAPMATGYPIGVAHDGALIATDAGAVLDRLFSESDALVIGPGLGTGLDTEQLIVRAVSMIGKSRCQALVVDADGINALCKADNLTDHLQPHSILTPHPGEAQRLLDALGLVGSPAGTQAQRVEVCNTLAGALGCIVVLKGKGTVVSDGTRCWTCQHGHPCLATGGTGDVLAGIIGSLVAQSINNPDLDLFISTCIGVDAHASCGKRWASVTGTHAGLDPFELCEHIAISLAPHRH